MAHRRKEGGMRATEAVQLRCQIFIAQRGGGTVWVPYKTLIGYGTGNRVLIGSKGEYLYSSEQFATRGAAEEAARQRAWDTIRRKFPSVRHDEVEWHLVAEGLGAFVPA
jgi:hypothetical protein